MDLSLFDRGGRPPDEIGRAESEEDLLWLMEALTRRNVHYLQQRERDGNPAPLLYQSGVRYELPQQALGDPLEVAEVRKAIQSLPWGERRKASRALDKLGQMVGGEHMRDYDQLLQQGSGDCDNMAAARAAEIRHYLGVEAMPYLSIGRPNGDGSGVTYHALVVWPDGSSEDPSILLGMGGEARSIDRFFEALKNKERRRMLASGELVKEWGRAPNAMLSPFVDALAARRGSSSPFNYSLDEMEAA